MKSKQINFFSDLEDIKPIAEEIELKLNLSYHESGLLESRNVPKYNSLLNTPQLGYVMSGDWNRIKSYIVIESNSLLRIRDIPQYKGGTKYAVDQLENVNSIELKTGGIYSASENILVAGRVSTISNAPNSKELFKLFSSGIKKKFKKIGSFYVGASAEKKLDCGWRLVTSDKSPREYDLAR